MADRPARLGSEMPVSQALRLALEPFFIERQDGPGLNPERIDEVGIEPPTYFETVVVDQFLFHRKQEQPHLGLAAEPEMSDFPSDLAKLRLHPGVGPPIIAKLHAMGRSGKATLNHGGLSDILDHAWLTLLGKGHGKQATSGPMSHSDSMTGEIASVGSHRKGKTDSIDPYNHYRATFRTRDDCLHAKYHGVNSPCRDSTAACEVSCMH